MSSTPATTANSAAGSRGKHPLLRSRNSRRINGHLKNPLGQSPFRKLLVYAAQENIARHASAIREPAGEANLISFPPITNYSMPDPRAYPSVPECPSLPLARRDGPALQDRRTPAQGGNPTPLPNICVRCFSATQRAATCCWESLHVRRVFAANFS